MESTIVHLLRHGEVDNPEGVVYGRLNGYALTPLGKKMGQVVADYLTRQERDITRVIASPLLRAQQTALPTAEAYGLPVETDPNLIEADNKFQGQQVNKNRLVLAHPKNWKHYTRPHEPSWGEPYRDILHRMELGVANALHEARGHEALVVSHQLPIVMMQRFLAGKPLSHSPLNRECSLASLTSLMFEGDTLVGWSYLEPAHELLKTASDMNPGTSAASIRR